MAEPFLSSPTHWEVISLEPFSLREYIISVDSGSTPNTGESIYWDGDIPWLTPKEITNNENIFVSATERNITKEGLDNCGAKLLAAETVMLTKRAPIGAVAINAVPMATNQGFLNFRCGQKLRPLYLAYWFKINISYLQQIANGSTYKELYKSDLFEFQIAIPSIEEQDLILSAVNAMQFVLLLGVPIEQSAMSASEMLNVQEQTRRLKKIRDFLMLKLFSGQLDASMVSNIFEDAIHG